MNFDPLNQKVLSIVNASAGSGKTYRLVKDYIKLLISDSDGHKSFSSIIAMTFTNKAALEMKERIIKGLDEISSPEHFNKTSSLVHELAEEIPLKPDEIISRCRKVLSSILHQYEDFNVMTIDKFNLKLIKSFSRDLDLPPEFEVVMDEDEIIEKIVDNLLNQLDDRESTHLNRLIYEYAKSNLDDESGWNFRNNLIQFGKIVKLERNQQIISRLLDSDFSFERFNSLRSAVSAIDHEYRKLLSELKVVLDKTVADPATIPGAGRSYNTICKLFESGKFPGKVPVLTDSFIQSLHNGTRDKSFPDELRTSLLQLNDYCLSKIVDYNRSELFLKNFFNLALLKFIAEALDRARQSEQLIRISEFNLLISELIRNEEAPFIYERLGNRYKHFLLDEFQDTSHLQWLNIVPLIHDSLSNLHKNLIVGDPKQSIYRFKNGIAEQFIELPRIYNPENDPRLNRISKYFESLGEVFELLDNWRSSEVIVDFNNTFFGIFRKKMPEHAQLYYTSIHQNVKRSIAGKVYVESMEGDIASADLIPGIVEKIEECLEAGYSHSDICILGNRNTECNVWAIGLNDLDYKVVSADSLLIHKDVGVQLAISFFKWRLRPGGSHEKKRFAELYFRYRKSNFQRYGSYFATETGKDGKTYRNFDDDRFIQDHFEGKDNFFFKYEHLYDLLQGFLRLIGTDELENPYLHHLADFVFNYGQRKGPDLKGFLSEYEKKKNTTAVQIPESRDAIKIMTMHKSKGLEFPVVIIPSLDFSLKIKGSMLVESGEVILYKQPGKSEQIEELIELYNYESEHILIDCINLCYVAMTRPKERLYISNFYKKDNFGAIFHDLIKSLEGTTDAGGGKIVYNKSLGKKKSEQLSEENNLFVPLKIRDKLWFPDIALQDKPELVHNEFLSDEMQYGRQFHALISRINSPDEIEPLITQGIIAGELEKKFKGRLHEGLTKLFDNPKYMELVTGSREVLNEQSIIVAEDRILRPDKVIIKDNEAIIIDFKTGQPNSKHRKQVLVYKQMFEAMGYPNCSAYVLYTESMQLDHVTE